MKNVKNDTKYIIKKILIGVGIAIVLFNLKKCNVYALTKIQVSYDSTSKITDTTGKKKIGEYKDSLLDLEFYVANNIPFDYYYPIIYKYRDENEGIKFLISGIVSEQDLSQENISLGSIGTEKNNAITSRYTVQYPPNIFLYDDSNNIICNTASTCDSSHNVNFHTYNYLYYNFIYYNYSTDSVSVGISSSIFGQYIYNNTTIDFYNSNVPFDLTMGTTDINYTPPVNDPLSNYTEVDITGKQAILIVPKNYLNLSNISYEYDDETDKHYIVYKYGVQRCVRPSLIDLNNFDDFALNGSWLLGFVNSSDIENIQEVCFDSPTLQSFTGLYTSPELQSTDSPYNYMGLLIYNSSKNYDNNEPDWINNQDVPYGANSVWVDTSLYNYYLVDDFNNFNQTISFINGIGENESLYIESLPTFTDLMEKTKNQQNIDDNLSTRQKINELLSLVKIPFDFLKGIITGTCEPLYAPFPHSNQNIVLPCMSNLFSDILTPAGYLSFRVLINGLLVYRIIIALIIFTENSLDPSDARIEVLDL